jgi:hypothetical protein
MNPAMAFRAMAKLSAAALRKIEDGIKLALKLA